MMGSGQYAKFFDNPAQAFTAQAFQQGNDLLAQVFGNKALSRQIAEESAAVAGIAPEMMKQMMAPAAAMLMGGLSQTAASQGLAAYFDQLADMFRGGPRPGLHTGAAQDLFSAWAQMMTGMMGAGQSPQGRDAEPPGDATPHPLGPWGAMMTGFMRGLQPPAEPEPEPEPEEEELAHATHSAEAGCAAAAGVTGASARFPARRSTDRSSSTVEGSR
jgi:hypothetical protein